MAQTVDRQWADERVTSGLSSGEGLIWNVRDPHVSIGAKGGEVDPGAADKRFLALESEFAAVLRILGRDGNTLSPVIREAWDTGDLSTLTKNSPARATGAHISIVGHITRDELRRYLDSTEAANGFANRFLWVCVKRSKSLPEGGCLRDEDLAPLVARLREALAFARELDEIKRDAAAGALWHKVYTSLSEGKPGLLGAVTARAEAQVMRLACLYALLDMSYVVTEEHLRAGLALWDYCERSARCIFGDTLGDPTADELLKALLARPKGMTRTDIRDHFGRNKSAREIARALDVLTEYGLARCTTEESGGRPAERWFAVEATAIA
jgi:hypothetical protein